MRSERNESAHHAGSFRSTAASCLSQLAIWFQLALFWSTNPNSFFRSDATQL
jgi:hypothetical protein